MQIKLFKAESEKAVYRIDYGDVDGDDEATLFVKGWARHRYRLSQIKAQGQIITWSGLAKDGPVD